MNLRRLAYQVVRENFDWQAVDRRLAENAARQREEEGSAHAQNAGPHATKRGGQLCLSCRQERLPCSSPIWRGLLTCCSKWANSMPRYSKSVDKCCEPPSNSGMGKKWIRKAMPFSWSLPAPATL